MIKDCKKEIEYEFIHIDSERYSIFLFICLFEFTHTQTHIFIYIKSICFKYVYIKYIY